MLVTAAQAQMPNAQATVDATATFYLNQGVLGATVILLLLFLVVAGWVIRAQNQDAKAKDQIILDLTKTVATIAQASIAANAQNAVAMAALEAALEARGRVIEELSRQVERMGSDVRHGLGNVLNGLNGIPEILRDKLETMREMLREWKAR